MLLYLFLLSLSQCSATNRSSNQLSSADEVPFQRYEGKLRRQHGCCDHSEIVEIKTPGCSFTSSQSNYNLSEYALMKKEFNKMDRRQFANLIERLENFLYDNQYTENIRMNEVYEILDGIDFTLKSKLMRRFSKELGNSKYVMSELKDLLRTLKDF